MTHGFRLTLIATNAGVWAQFPLESKQKLTIKKQRKKKCTISDIINVFISRASEREKHWLLYSSKEIKII